MCPHGNLKENVLPACASNKLYTRVVGQWESLKVPCHPFIHHNISAPTSKRPARWPWKTCVQGYSVEGALPSPACLPFQRKNQNYIWWFISRHIEWIVVPIYQYTLGWWDSKETIWKCLAIPLRSCKVQHLWRECFLTRSKSPGRLPRSIKVKDLTLQKKVKEWVQNLLPNQVCYKWCNSHNKQWWRFKCKSSWKSIWSRYLQNVLYIGGGTAKRWYWSASPSFKAIPNPHVIHHGPMLVWDLICQWMEL